MVALDCFQKWFSGGFADTGCVGEGGDKVPGRGSGSDPGAAEVGGSMAANDIIDGKKSGNISRHLSQGLCDGLDIHQEGPGPMKNIN